MSVGPAQSSERNVSNGSNIIQTSFKDNKSSSYSNFKVGCVLSCCYSCSYCTFTRASAKERIKSRSFSGQNKACQRCMLCKSMSFCPSCSQCPQCCHRTECRGKVTNVWASLARNGRKSSGDFCLEGGLHPSIQTETPIDKVSPSSKWLCQPSKEPVLKGSLNQSHEEVGSRKGGYQVVSGFLQPAFPCPQTKQKMETNLGPESVELIPQYQYLQDGNSGDNPVILTGEWVTSLDFSEAYFHIPINQRSQKYLRFFLYNQTFQFTALPFGLATAPLEFTKVVKEVKLMAQARGIRIHQYLDDWLLRTPYPDTYLQHTQTLLALCQQLGWVVNMKKSELIPQQVFNFVGYRFDLVTGRVLPTPDWWTTLQEKLKFIKNQKSCTVKTVHVSDRTAHSNGKASVVRLTSYEAHPMALEATLACSRSFGEGYSGSSVSSPPSRLVVRREQCAEGPTPAPPSTRSSAVYRRLKRRLGCNT